MTRLLGLALLAATPLAPAAAQTAAPVDEVRGTRLTVVAAGETAVAPDLATVSAGVVTQAGGAAAAMADNARRMAATVAAIRRAGIADRDVQTSAVRLAPQYRYADGQAPQITGYQATDQVTVRLRDLAAAGSVLDALVAAGANQIDGPNLSVDRPEAALDAARARALATARARAELYARAAGLAVRRIVSIAEEGTSEPGPRPMMAMALRKAAPTPIEPGEQTLSVSLRVVFELG